MNLGSRYLSGGCGCGGSTPQHPTTPCDTRKIQSISRVGDKVLVTFDDCTFMTALDTVLDTVSLWGASNNSVSPTPPAGNSNVIMSLGGKVIDADATGDTVDIPPPNASDHETGINEDE